MNIRFMTLIVVAAGELFGFSSPALPAGRIIYFPVPVWQAGLFTDIQPASGPDSQLNSAPDLPGSYQLNNGLYGASAFAQVSGVGLPSPVLSAYDSASINPTLAPYSNAGSSASLYYSFQIIGPDGLVPTIITAAGNTAHTVDGQTAGAASVEIYSVAGGDIFNASLCSATNECNPGEPTSFSLHSTFQLNANQYYNVYLNASASAQYFGSASASVDPYIQIDPLFINAGQYSLWVTPGIGNTPAVPEPESYAMLLAGLGLMGLAGRRKSRVRQSAYAYSATGTPR